MSESEATLPKLTSEQVEFVDEIGADVRVSRGIADGVELALRDPGHDPELLSRAMSYVVEALERASDNLAIFASGE